MKWFALAIALVGACVALVASWYWLKSSEVPIEPGFGPPGSGRNPEPDGEAAQAMAWTIAVMTATIEASNLNKKAARWTAASVFLSAVATILGTLA